MVRRTGKNIKTVGAAGTAVKVPIRWTKTNYCRILIITEIAVCHWSVPRYTDQSGSCTNNHWDEF